MIYDGLEKYHWSGESMENKDVFISYKTDEYGEACRVRTALEGRGISCWMAPECIPGGSSYAVEIPRAIRGCRVFVLVLSRKTQTSRWVPKELDSAINEGKIIMPFMLEDFVLDDAFNFYLSNVQRYPAYENKAAALERMIRDIRSIVKAPAVKISGRTVETEDWFKPAGQVHRKSEGFRPVAPETLHVEPVSRPAPEPMVPKSRTWASQPIEPVTVEPREAPVPSREKSNPDLRRQCMVGLLWGVAALCSMGFLVVPEILSVRYALGGAYGLAKEDRGLKVMIIVSLLLSALSLAGPVALLFPLPPVVALTPWLAFGILVSTYCEVRRKARSRD